MGKSGRRKAAAEVADELRRDSAWPPRFVGLSQQRIEHSFGALDFEDVTMRCFPLRAKLSRLELFCDRYLNMDIPEDVARFRPAAPYVLMAVVNYGRMSAAASNLGWSAQNEVLFSVPIVGSWNQWNPPEGGSGGEAVTIRDFATVSPFIFVDDDWSVATGRELFGWPKVSCRLEADLNPWLRSPRERRRLMTLQTLVVPELYAGRGAEFRTLLEIEQETPRLEMPPDLEYVFNPLLRLSKSLVDAMAGAPDLLQVLARMAVPTSAPSVGEGGEASTASPAPIASMLTQLFRSLGTVPPDLYGNTINLKQFRAPLPRAACYQALNNARMRLRRFNHGGLMGSAEMLRGDPTGGISILLRRQDAYPIIESLGLQVDGFVRREGEATAILKPVLPFWMSVDLHYERARRICWRAERPKEASADAAASHGWQRWRGEERNEATVADSSARRLGNTVTRLPEFNTALGPVVEAVQGPFDFRDVTVRVLPLRASAERLQEALPAEGKRTPYQPVIGPDGAAWAFLVVTSYGRMSSAANDIGWWARNEVGLSFVATSEELIGLSDQGVRDMGIPPPELRTLHWLHWPYMFADSPIAVTEGREVLGLPTAYCRLHRGEDPWLEPDGPSANDRLLRLDVLDYPALGVGQQAVERRLFDVERLVDRGDGGPGGQAAGSVVRDFLSRHLDKFREGLRIRNLSVKEFRDEESPDRPCYQSVVAFDRAVRRRKGAEGGQEDSSLWVRPMRGGYEVRFHGSPSYDIVDTLGLEVDRREEGPSGGETSVCKVVDPFWIKADVRAELPVDLLHRSVNRPWSTPGYLPFAYNELWFRDIYERQLEVFEKVVKTLAGEGVAALPSDELSLEARRRMNDLRREWEKDPTVWELETFGELVRTLRGLRSDRECEVTVEKGDEVDDSGLENVESAAAWRARYSGVYACSDGERRFEVEISKQGYGLSAREADSAVLFANVLERSAIEHVDRPSLPLHLVAREGKLLAHVLATSDFSNRIEFRFEKGEEQAVGLTWEMGRDLDRGAEARRSWDGVRAASEERPEIESPAPEKKPAKKTAQVKKAKKKPAGKKSVERPTSATTAAKTPAKKTAKAPAKKTTKKTAKKRAPKKKASAKRTPWPEPEVLDLYAGKYRVEGDEGFLTFHRPYGEVVDGKAGVEQKGLLATTPTKSAFELVPGSEDKVFTSTGKRLHRFEFTPAKGRRKGRVRYRYGKRSVRAVRVEDGEGKAV